MNTTLLDDQIKDEPLSDALAERYLSYALSTIMNRALPDVRDGLKPVQRRLLYAMRQLKLDPQSRFKKCARVVGDVMGKYHPHGDQAIYDALVRMAQDFSVRYLLIDGQGNFGNVDGDNAAAMRYTEARLTRYAEVLLEDINQDTVDFRSTYTDEGEEPIVLPAAYPNLLANGASGIAVGMATNIPPHNIGELCGALLHLIKQPKATTSALMKYIPGPDLPTGGVLVEPKESIEAAYDTGRGSFRLRAKWHKEEGNRGGYVIIVTEIPYQVQKSRLIEKIADLIQAKKLHLLADIDDESAADVRIVLEPKSRMIDPVVLMETLFRQTDLETRISLNMNVLDGGQVPRVMSLGDVLRAFLNHRKEILERRTRFRLDKISNRLVILKGYLVAYLNLDEVIRIIREGDDPKAELMAAFKLKDVQAEAILNMRLRSLRKLEEKEIKSEHHRLTAEKKEFNALLKSQSQQWKRITEEIRAIREEFGAKSANGARRTAFDEAPELDIDADEVMTLKEPITVICSEKGWIRALKGHVESAQDVKYKEGDRGRFFFPAETTDKLILFGTNGRFYTINADKLPRGRGNGEPVRLMIDLDNDHDIVTLFKHEPGRTLIVVSTKGHGLLVDEDEVIASKRGGKVVLNLAPNAEACACAVADGDTVGVIGENRKLLLFPIDEVPKMTRGRGVLLQRYKDGGLSDVTVFTYDDGLTVGESRGRSRSFGGKELKDWRGKRAQAGRLPPKGFPRRNRFS
ncbi:MAG: DNA topoisomerase IV subunit A [Alphaproteobacteria bacterium]|nr:MAG: DNA topoisomerase IV subunit A [Alphaproteobacteria bacterium]